MRIDAHAHIWDIDFPWMAWLRESRDATYASAQRDYTVADLKAVLDLSGNDRVVLVQAATTPDETAWLLDVAARTPFVHGVVGWVGLSSREHTLEQLGRFRAAENLVGVRYMDGWPPDGHVLRSEAGYPSAQLLAQRDLALDMMMIEPEDLKHVARLAEALPDLRIIVDHLARIHVPPPGEPFSRWADAISALAGYPNVFAKYSGWSTRLPRVTADYIAPYIEHVLGEFGAARVMYAGNWPICTMASDYKTMYDASVHAIRALDTEDLDAVLGGTASHVYRSRARDALGA